MKTFHFRYDNYIYIQNPLNDLIYQKIFNSNKEQKKGRFCTFCRQRSFLQRNDSQTHGDKLWHSGVKRGYLYELSG